jgi:short-subunit dehydrogenase
LGRRDAGYLLCVERRVLVTGAGSGIGLATAVSLARAGFRTWGLVPDDNEARALSDAAGDAGAHVEVLRVDLSAPAQRSAVASELELYGLVNNAGFMNAGMIRDVDLADARRQLEVMVIAAMDLACQALPYMLERSEGRIVNVTSSALHTTTPFTGWYAATKAALRELNDALRVELAWTGVDVVEVEPGGFSTNIWRRARTELEHRRARSSRPRAYSRPLQVIDRFSNSMSAPEQVADVVLQVLTTAHPGAHRRVGKDAVALRVAELLPDAITDRVAALATGRA